MAGKNDDLDDTVFADENEDDLTSILRTEMEKITDKDGDDDDDDDGGFNAPLEEEERDIVEEEEGVKRAREAREERDKPSKPEAKPDAEGESKPKEDDDPKPAKPEDAASGGGKGDTNDGENPDEDKPEDDTQNQADDKPVSDEDYNAAISGLPAAVQKRINDQQKEYAEIMAPFAGREEQLAKMGTTPKDAVKWLANVNDYAQRSPSDYMAWFVGSMAGDNAEQAEKVLGDAAEKLGFKISKVEAPKDDDDDDPFLSESEKKLRQENKELREKLQGSAPQPELGPDSPAEQGRRMVMDVIGEINDAGKPVRPHFEKLQPMITEIVKAKRQQTGQPMTREDLVSAYDQALLAHPDTREEATKQLLAAQADPNVPKRDDNAEATAKAKAASNKIIDGSSQSAGHQPAQDEVDPNMGIEDFLRHQMNKMSSA